MAFKITLISAGFVHLPQALAPSRIPTAGEPGRGMFTKLLRAPTYLGCLSNGWRWAAPALLSSRPPAGCESGCLEHGAGLHWGALAHACGWGGGRPGTPG